MALSGSFETNHFSNSTVKETWMVFNWNSSQRIPENDSSVNWSVTVKRQSTSWVQFYNTNINVNGTQYGRNGQYDNDTVIASGSFRITHNNEGYGTFWVSMSANVYYSQGGYIGGSQTCELNTIPRQANITYAPDFNDEENPTINYNNPAGNSVTSLKACISFTGAEDDIAYRDISKTGTSYTFNLTAAERKLLRQNSSDSNSKTVKFFIQTVIGENTFNSVADRTCWIINANPTANPTVKDVLSTSLALTGDENKIIKGLNQINYVINATALKETSIASYKAINGSQTKTTSTGTFNNVDSANFTLIAKDKRGNSIEYTVRKTLINYEKLTCNLKAGNPTADGDMAFQISGNYFNSTFGKVANTLSLAWRYKENNGAYSSWTAITPTKTGNIYNATVNLTGLNYQSTYTFQARAIDKINTTGALSPEIKVKTIPIFDWGENDFNINGELLIKEENIFDLIYPVGAIYMSVNSTSPATLFGGTWVQIKDTFLLAAGNTYTAGSTGGKAKVNLSVENLPSHTHTGKTHVDGAHVHYSTAYGWMIDGVGNARTAVAEGSSGFGADIKIRADGSEHQHWFTTDATGNGKEHENMPPYLAVFVWKRTK